MCKSRARARGFSLHELPFEYLRRPGVGTSHRCGVQAEQQSFSSLTMAVHHAAPHRGSGSERFWFAHSSGLPVMSTSRDCGFPFQRARPQSGGDARDAGGWLCCTYRLEVANLPDTRAHSQLCPARHHLRLGFPGHPALPGGGERASFGVAAFAIAAIVAALPSMFCFVRKDSRCALDNASGVAKVLMASQLASGGSDLGILITSGEELAWPRTCVAAGAAHPILSSCDTVDDAAAGAACTTELRRREYGLRRKQSPRAGVKLAIGRMIPGISPTAWRSPTGYRIVTITLW